MKKQVSIIGCGWLGLPLAKYLVDKGYQIKGSTTSEEKLDALTKNDIDPYYVELNSGGISGEIFNFLYNSEILVINIPPGLRKNPNKNHVGEVSHLIDAIEKSEIKKVVYISSTSVFKDEITFPIIDASAEPNNTTKSAEQLIEIEKLLQNNSNFKTTILRFGGLFDDERHPAKHLSGKENISNPEAPINLIHKQDCIAIISSILKHNIFNLSLNASYPKHLNKATYYSSYCRQSDLPPPTFNYSEKSKGKIIDSSKLVQLLNYGFKQAP